MSSLTSKDRVSLCSFTFSDGRHCRTPRLRDNPRFCPYHAQKEARARAAQSLGKDLAYFFSGDYLSACDLSTALGRLIPAVLRGDVKPRAARTVAYLAQTLLQAIHISQHEYTNAFDTDEWRQSIRNSVKGNHDYRFPPASKPETPDSHPSAPTVGAFNGAAGFQPGSLPATPHVQPASPNSQPTQTPVNCHSERSEESASSSDSPLATHHSPLPQTPAPSPHAPLPPTSAEFLRHVLAGLQTGSFPATPHVQPAPANAQPAETPQPPAAHPNNPPPTCPPTPPKATSSSPSAPLTPTDATSPATPQPHAQPPASQPVSLPESRPSTSPREPNRDAPLAPLQPYPQHLPRQ